MTSSQTADRVGLTVSELVDLLRSRNIRLPFEIGAFIALETCEEVLDRPTEVAPDDVRLGDDGSITLFSTPKEASSESAARAVVTLLARLLVASGSGVPPMMLRLVEEGPSDGSWELPRLRDELEASLLPLNRSAARRVLSRLLREVRRPDRGSTPPPVGDVDGDLDALLDGREPPPPAPAVAPTQKMSALTESELSALDDVIEAPATPSRAPDVVGLQEERKRRPAWLLYLGVFVLVFVGAVAALKPAWLTSVFGGDDAPAAQPLPTAPETAPAPEAVTNRGDLAISVAPARAQVFLFVGRSPAVVEDLPTGVAYEFVAIPDGGESARAVVPADVNWQPGDELVLHELHVPIGNAQMAFSDLALGESLLQAESMGSPTERLGRVRVITEPEGARVYLLVGFSPDVVVRDVRVDREQEILVYHDGHPLQRATVGTDRWVERDGRKVADVSLTL